MISLKLFYQLTDFKEALPENLWEVCEACTDKLCEAVAKHPDPEINSSELNTCIGSMCI